mmetsp:Transcript_107966/g.322879  ORF Transcript_107966/g.322879 Transcript_107966/m.322879 type:complete len:89 (-) Transcript_107966:18-284(-)
MQLSVKVVSGEMILLDVELSDTIRRVKEKLHRSQGIPPAQQRLIFAAKQLEDERTVADYRLESFPRPVYLVRTAPKPVLMRPGWLGGA